MPGEALRRIQELFHELRKQIRMRRITASGVTSARLAAFTDDLPDAAYEFDCD